MSAPVSRRRENTRARLLDAAALVFAEVGLEGASVEKICDRAGFTRGAFYSNFDSKDELFLELCQSVGEERLNAVRESVAEVVSAGEVAADADVMALVRRIMESGDDNRLSVLLMSEIRIRALRDATFGEAYMAQERAMTQSTADIIQGIVDAGIISLRVDVVAAANMLMLLWEGSIVRGAIQGMDGESLQACGSDSLAQLVELIIAPPA